MQHIHAWQVVSMLILAAVLFYHRRYVTGPAKGASTAVKKPPPAPLPKIEQTPEELFTDLRREAIETDPKRLVLAGELKPDEAFGVLMEIGITGSVVTLACLADGDARLLYQTGGGMIGGGSHESVRKAAKDLVAQAQAALPRMTRASAYPLPGPDRIRFYVLTPRGVMTTETDRKVLSERPGELSTLYQSGQEVVAQMRQVGDERSQAGS